MIGNPQTSSPLRRFVRECGFFLLFVLLTAVMTYPWVFNLHDAVSDRGDTYTIAWSLWWDYHQTFSDPLRLFHANVFYPYEYTLAFSENDYGIALLFFPLFAVGLRPVTVHSVATFTAFAFSGYGMFRLARTLSGSTRAALVAGIFFAFVPYRFQRLPHLHLIFAGWIPLVLEALVLFVRRPSWHGAASLGAPIVMNALTCVTWFVLSLLPLAMSAAYLAAQRGVWRDRALWIRGAAALCGAGAVMIPFLLPYLHVARLYGFVRSADEARGLSATPLHWLCASPRNKLWQNLGAIRLFDEFTLFPGLLVIALAVCGLLLVAPLYAESGSRANRAGDAPMMQATGFLRRVGYSEWARILLYLAAFSCLLLAFVVGGYGKIELRVFGAGVLSAASPGRSLLLASTLFALRCWVSPPVIVRRLIDSAKPINQRLRRRLRADPRASVLALGLLWTAIGFCGSLGMNFFLHRLLFEYVPLFKSMRAPVRWATICYVGLALLAGLGAMRLMSFLARRMTHRKAATTIVISLVIALLLFELRAAPVHFVRGEVYPDALTLRLKETEMRGGIVELPAEAGAAPGYFRYMLRAADHGKPLVTATSSFKPPLLVEIEKLTAANPVPERLLDVLESIPTSYLVINDGLLPPATRRRLEAFLRLATGSGRLRFVRSYEADGAARRDLYAVTKIEPHVRSEAALPFAAVAAADDPIEEPATRVLAALDGARAFVRQQYVDLLHREPEEKGATAWISYLDECGDDLVCDRERRAKLVADFFLTPEFKSNYAVWRFYHATLGRSPHIEELISDAKLLASLGEHEFARLLMEREPFRERYSEEQSNAEFASRLLHTTNSVLRGARRDDLITRLDAGALTRAGAAAEIAALSATDEREQRTAFVALAYLLLLRREPEGEGIDAWRRVLDENGGDYQQVIDGFIMSDEYRRRFGHR